MCRLLESIQHRLFDDSGTTRSTFLSSEDDNAIHRLGARSNSVTDISGMGKVGRKSEFS